MFPNFSKARIVERLNYGSPDLHMIHDYGILLVFHFFYCLYVYLLCAIFIRHVEAH